MKIKNLKLKIACVVSPSAIIAFAVALRLIPHPANFAPIAAMALFGGAYLDKKYALIVPLVAMFVSDYFLGFHNTMIFVYGSFLISGYVGLRLRTRKSFFTIVGGVLTSSVLFFIITNFGVWLVSGLYQKTIYGLFQCYLYAIPFFRNSLIGDFFYSGLFFGSYELLIALLKKPALSSKKYENLYKNRG